MATHSSILAWRILWTEEPGRLWPIGSQESDTTERLSLALLSAACFLCGLEQGAYLLPPSFWFAAQVLSLTLPSLGNGHDQAAVGKTHCQS